MENIRTIVFRTILILAIISGLCFQEYFNTQPVSAWNNLGVHPSINELAYDSFVSNWMPSDQYLKQATLDGGLATGESWQPSDGTEWTYRKPSVTRDKSINEWLKEGGFSADEPELNMSLVHFYDPIREPHYLTDYIETKLPDYIGKASNPNTSAYQWAFESNDNPFSFISGEQNFLSALEHNVPNDINYGRAWRAVGETMHLISDMAVPAHVRNDAHIPYANLWDPLEYFTDAGSVSTFCTLGQTHSATTDIGDYHTSYSNGGQDIRTLFKGLATWTNQNFFSLDTVPQYQSDKTPNGFTQYPNPKVTIDPNITGYYTTTLDGISNFPLARASIAGLIWKTPTLVVDQNVCAAQRSVLLPTAVKASAAVLDAFLPRFQVKIDKVEADPTAPGTYAVTAHIQHIATREWPNDPTIRNGAHIVVDSKDIEIPSFKNLNGSDNLNTIKYNITAKEGSTVTIYYNFGGYKISSADYKITNNLSIDPTSLSGVPNKAYTFNAKIGSLPKGSTLNWLINGSSKQNSTDTSFSTTFTAEGTYNIKVSMLDNSGKEQQSATATANIKNTITTSAVVSGLDKLHNCTSISCDFNFLKTVDTVSILKDGQWVDTNYPGQLDIRNNAELLKPVWTGTSFTAQGSSAVGNATTTASGTVSNDGTMLLSFTLTNSDPAGYNSSITVANIPLLYVKGNTTSVTKGEISFQSLRPYVTNVVSTTTSKNQKSTLQSIDYSGGHDSITIDFYGPGDY
jgi:hypothetical protein